MTNREKAFELIESKYDSAERYRPDVDVISVSYAKQAVQIASQTDWFFTDRGEYPQTPEPVWTDKGIAKYTKSFGFAVNLNGKIVSLDVRCWTYLPKPPKNG